MAHIRIENNTLPPIFKTKSGAVLINERTRFYRNQNQQTRPPYIPNGYNTDNLIVNTAYNDQNTINFNNLKYFNLKEYFDDNPNERNTLSQQLATPSTFPDLNINTDTLGNHDQLETLEKFLKKGNSIETKFTAFNDREYIENNLNNQDFLKGEGQYSFLDTNLYEETSIEIELDVPRDALLEYTARMQEVDGSNPIIYGESSWDKSPYNFRKTFTTNIGRKNSPFLMYNFKENCFESRGYYKKLSDDQNGQSNYEGKELDIPDIGIIPSINFFVKKENSVITDIYANSSTLIFKDKLQVNLQNHYFALTNTPINHLRAEENYFNIFNYFSLPTLQFGFPHFPTFHAFDENLMSMKKYLNKNLIIDRVTIDCDLKVKAEVKIPQGNEIDIEDIDFRDGLNFSLNYFILNDSKNKKDAGLNFLALNPQEYFKDFDIVNNDGNPINSKLSTIQSIKHYTSKLTDNLNSNPPYDIEFNTFINSKQNLKIHRKLWKDLENSLIVTDMSNRLDEISFNKNIVSFGNVLFHASNKNFLTDITDNKPVYTTDKLLRFQQMKNNNDLVIDTLADNITKSALIEDISGINNDVSNISDMNICLDFEDKIKINSYVKKSSAYPRYLNSHNLNYQVEFKSTFNSTQQYSLFGQNNNINLSTNEGLIEEKTYNHTRNMLNNKLDGKDVINAQSQLIQDSTKRINARKTSKDLFKNLRKTDLAEFDQTEKDYYYEKCQASDLTNLHFNRTSNFSPYILTPDDNLAFCFSISPTISPKLFIHSCKIKAGKVKFTLHGYMQKNNEKFYDDNNLKNSNQNNLSSVIIGDISIVSNKNNNVGYLTEYIDTFQDRLFNNKVFQHFTDTDQNIPSNPNYRSIIGSKIRLGKSYIPYLKLENNDFPILNDITKNIAKFEEYIFDDFKTHTKIFDKIVSKISDIENFDVYKAYEIAKELTFYKDKITKNELISNAQDNIYIKVKDNTNNIPNLFDENGLPINITYKQKFDEILNQILLVDNTNQVDAFVLAFFIFTAFVSQTNYNENARKGVKKYLNSFVNFKKYGQFRDNFEQRLYTSLIDKNDNYNYVIEQKFINNVDGTELTNLNDIFIPRNKSRYLELIDSGFKSITAAGVITPWDGEDFYNRRHVVYNDVLTPIFA